MKKADEIANPQSCLNKAKDDECIFVLLERDDAAADAIRRWAYMRCALGLNNWADRQIAEALDMATAMERSRDKRQQARSS